MPIRAICLGATAATLGGLMLLAGCSAQADTHSGVGGPAQVRAAQRIALDPATHLPIAAERADASAPPADSGAGAGSGRRVLPAVPEEVRLPDGTVGVRVAQQYFHTITVCRQRDGSFSTRCPAGASGARP
jgi:hypothetical protein